MSLGVAVNAGKGGLDGIADEEAVVDAEDRQLRRDFHVCGVCGLVHLVGEIVAGQEQGGWPWQFRECLGERLLEFVDCLPKAFEGFGIAS